MTHADRDHSEEPSERVERYAEPIVVNLGLTKRETEPMHIEVAHAVIAVADAELAEKDATIARLEAEVERLGSALNDRAEQHRAAVDRGWSARQRTEAAEGRAEKAEAALARVEAWAQELDENPWSDWTAEDVATWLRKALRGEGK